MKWITLGYLCINAWTDCKNRIIDLRYTLVYIILEGIILWDRKEMFHWYGMLPGVFLMLLAIVYKKQIGNGDGIMVAAIGSIIGLNDICIVLQNGFLIAGTWGMMCYIVKKNDKCSIPFAPCLLSGYLVHMLGETGIML